MNELATVSQEPSVGLVTTRGIQLSTYEEMKSFARDVANSGLAPRDFKTPEAILVALQHGMELGLSPAQALQSIAVINGRPVVWGDAACALVKAHPECEDILETFERGDGGESMLAKCEVLRRGKVPVVRTFSVAQAKKAGLWGKAGPWTNYPQRMLQMRARSWAIRDAFPDALKGMGVAEEVRDYEPRKVEARVVSTEMVLPGDERNSNQQNRDAVGDAESAQVGAGSSASSGETQSRPSPASAANGLVSGDAPGAPREEEDFKW